MTGYTVHTGSTEKFAAGWDTIFGKSREPARKVKATKKSARSKSAKKRKRA
jgi:hypothetical protein